MQFKIVHQIPNRLRLRYAKQSLSAKQAMLAQILVSHQEGIDFIEFNPLTGSILIKYSEISQEQALSYISALNKSYFEDEELLSGIHEPTAKTTLFESILSMGVGILFKRLMPLPLRRLFIIQGMLPRLQEGLKAVGKKKFFCADTLDSAALSLSFLSGNINTTGSILALLNMSEIIEDYISRKSYDSLTQSLLLTNQSAQLLRDNEEITVDVQTLKIGDKIIVRAGCIIPVDGIVIDGEAEINQSSMTGESLPVNKKVGNIVFASSFVEEGEIIIEISACGGQTKVSKIIDMIDRSQSLKAASQIRAERLSDSLVFYNFLLAACTYLFTRNFTKAASTLLVDYSCAMKLSAPISVLAAMRSCAELGIVVKGGKFLENLAQADTIIFDKTGTLTQSTPTVKEIICFNQYEEKEVLKISACLEEHFPHSLARAVVQEAEKRDISHPEEHTKVSYIVAHGISSSMNNKKLLIGSAHFIFEDEAVPLTEEIQSHIDYLNQTGYSKLFLAIDGELAGIIVIEDPIREEAADVIRELRQLGIQNIIMLTGDSEATAKIIAHHVGITEYYAQTLPDDKVTFVEHLQKTGNKVIMVGDGVNDSPALSAASVGIAMGQSSSITSETADILLPDNGIQTLPMLRKISINLMNRMKTNNQLIVGINTSLIFGNLSGRLQTNTAAFVHNGSTFAISLASMRGLYKKVR